MYKFFSVLCTYLILCSHLFALPLKPLTSTQNNQTKSLESVLNSKDLVLTKSEIKIGKNLATLYDIARKGYYNKQLTNNLIKETNKNRTFYIFKTWLQNIKKISNSRSLFEIKKVCQSILKSKTTNPTLVRLIDNNKTFCFQKYLSFFSKEKPRGKKLSSEIGFFKENILYFLGDNNISDLQYLLSQYSQNTSDLTNLSEKVSNYFISHNQVPPSAILQYLRIDHRLTKYIQIKGIESNSTQNILYSEFKKLIDETYTAADSNDDERVISQKLTSAINYFELSKSHLPLKESSLRFLGLGKSLMRRSYFEPSRKAYNAIIKNTHLYREDALFELMWTYINNEDYDDAFNKVIKKHSLHKNIKNLKDSKIKFWIAYSMKEESIKGFEDIFENIISSDPVSYYAIISTKLMDKKSSVSNSNTFLTKSNAIESNNNFDFKLDTFVYNALKRLKVWSQIDYKPLINIESNSLSQISLSPRSSADKKQFKHAISILKARIFSDSNNYLESFKVVYRDLENGRLSFNSDVLNVLYPKPYWSKIQKYSTGMDPIIPLSLIRQESAFNPRAQSHVGARGLMQLMPYTAKQFKRNLKVTQLNNPNLNLSIGSKYLYNLMKQYDFNLVYTLSAYNAGEGRVKEWRTKYLTNTSILHNIENIPFSETRKYVKLIFRNIFFYKLINEDQINRTIADTDEPNKIFDVYLGFNK